MRSPAFARRSGFFVGHLRMPSGIAERGNQLSLATHEALAQRDVAMTEAEIAAAAEILADARRSGTQIEGLPVTPSSVAEAHEIQDRVAVMVGQPIGAFKAGAPPDAEPTRG